MKRGQILSLLVALPLLTASAWGVSLNGDPAAQISGNVLFQEANHWTADIQYAVYAPGTYAGSHPDAATQYIYAYQIFNHTGSLSTLSTLSVGLLEGADAVHVSSDATYGVLGGNSTLLAQAFGAPPTSAVWAVSIPPGQSSQVLLFASDKPPIFNFATLKNGGLGDTHMLPSPQGNAVIPEPLTLAALGLGCFPIAGRLRRRLTAA